MRNAFAVSPHSGGQSAMASAQSSGLTKKPGGGGGWHCFKGQAEDNLQCNVRLQCYTQHCPVIGCRRGGLRRAPHSTNNRLLPRSTISGRTKNYD